MTNAESDKNAFKQMIVKNIAQNEDVLSQCIDTESDAIELLEDIITLRVIIRGYSVAATWLEIYTAATKNTTKKNPGLHKTLQKL